MSAHDHAHVRTYVRTRSFARLPARTTYAGTVETSSIVRAGLCLSENRYVRTFVLQRSPLSQLLIFPSDPNVALAATWLQTLPPVAAPFLDAFARACVPERGRVEAWRLSSTLSLQAALLPPLHASRLSTYVRTDVRTYVRTYVRTSMKGPGEDEHLSEA